MVLVEAQLFVRVFANYHENAQEEPFQRRCSVLNILEFLWQLLGI